MPLDRGSEEMTSGIPITYVPARNTVFLALALAYAEVVGSFDIYIGVNAIDYSGYPDCRPDFIAAFQRLANLATRAAVEGQGTYRIHAPLVDMTKAEIIQHGVVLGVDYDLTQFTSRPPRERLVDIVIRVCCGGRGLPLREWQIQLGMGNA